MNTVDKDRLELAVKDVVEKEGAELIDFKFFLASGKYVLRCLVDYARGGITLDACAAINKKIFAYLDQNNDSGDDFVVEVNSPGLDRRLKSKADFLRVKGRIVSLWLKAPFDGKDQLEAELTAVDNDKLYLLHKGRPLEIDLNKVKSGKPACRQAGRKIQ